LIPTLEEPVPLDKETWRSVKEPRPHRNRPDDLSTDLVEYFIVAVPGPESLVGLTPALAELVEQEAIRILDLVVVVKDAAGAVAQLELDDVDSLAALRALDHDIGGLLSDHDIELASLALAPGSTGVILVTEDRWAEPLSAAAQRSGGQIIAGDRIPPSRVERVVADRDGEHRNTK
jgi:hypothetical protein